MEEIIDAYKIFIGRPERKRPLSVDWKIILECILGRWGGKL
jgi:hypothetical protein